VSVASDLVAVIDDDPMIRRALKLLLSASGYVVELYDSAEAFLQCATTCSAICLLIDVQLGRGSGFDLARQLAAAGFEFPIIFMTANIDKEVVRRAAEAGGFGCLEKPFAEKLLLDLLIKSKVGAR
jgi:FixJ family two-component response regulator